MISLLVLNIRSYIPQGKTHTNARKCKPRVSAAFLSASAVVNCHKYNITSKYRVQWRHYLRIVGFRWSLSANTTVTTVTTRGRSTCNKLYLSAFEC